MLRKRRNWIRTVSIKEWNDLIKFKSLSPVSIDDKVGLHDKICFYVRGTSNIKGIAQVSDQKSLRFLKTGDVNYFGIANQLEFVKDKDEMVKFLKNYEGVANFGKPVPESDFELILDHMIPDSRVPRELEIEIQLEKPPTQGTDYEKMFTLENSLRKFVSEKLQVVSKDWTKDRAPDREAVKKWIERMEENRSVDARIQQHNILDFSDFPDLLTLIIAKHNWRDCFEKVFGQKTVFEGKMTELSRIRNDIAHNRKLDEEQKDALDLYSRQIMRIISSVQ